MFRLAANRIEKEEVRRRAQVRVDLLPALYTVTVEDGLLPVSCFADFDSPASTDILIIVYDKDPITGLTHGYAQHLWGSRATIPRLAKAMFLHEVAQGRGARPLRLPEKRACVCRCRQGRDTLSASCARERQ